MFKPSELEKNLLHSEYETAKELYINTKGQYQTIMIVALAYKAGRTEMRDCQKANLHKAYKQLAEANDRISELERILRDHFHNNTKSLVPNEIITEQPIPGEKQEDETHE